MITLFIIYQSPIDPINSIALNTRKYGKEYDDEADIAHVKSI